MDGFRIIRKIWDELKIGELSQEIKGVLSVNTRKTGLY